MLQTSHETVRPVRLCEASGQLATTVTAQDVEVTLLRPGTSSNGTIYPPTVLEAAVPLFEGVTAFCDHPRPQDAGRTGGRSVRDVVGSYRDVTFDGERLRGILRLVDSGMAALVAQVLHDQNAGLPTPNIGLSADMTVLAHPTPDGRREVARILKVHAVDVVVDPAAGGAFERLREAHTREEETMTSDASVTDPLYEARLQACGDLLTTRLAASGLPPAARHHIAEAFVGRIFAPEELDRAIRSLRELAGELVQEKVIHDGGASQVHARLSLRDRLQYAADRLFGLDIPDSVRTSVGHPRGLRELFAAAGFDGHLGWEIRHLQEANEVTTAVMANIVGTSMTKRLVQDYSEQPKWWKPFAVEVAVRDMKQQERIRLNDFAALSEVSENGAYTNLPWDDAKETYTPGKRGNLVTITLETIINDDLRAVQTIPRKLARAAGVTINEFVASLFTANGGQGPAMSDTYNIFDATHHQGNLGSAALDLTSFGAAMTAIARTTDTAGKRMGLMGRWLLIPPELEQTAFTILYSSLKPGSPNNDRNIFQGRAEYVIVPQFTDPTNWYLLADRSQVELIEIGYLNGQEAPELLIQDDARMGSAFTNDVITYKVRWIFGGGWLDYRGAYGAIVAD